MNCFVLRQTFINNNYLRHSEVINTDTKYINEMVIIKLIKKHEQIHLIFSDKNLVRFSKKLYSCLRNVISKPESEV